MSSTFLPFLAAAADRLPLARRLSSAVSRRKAFHDAGGRPMPGPAPSLRGLGSLHEIGRRGLLPTFAAHARAAEGPCFLLWTGPVPHVTVTDPELIRGILLHQDPRIV